MITVKAKIESDNKPDMECEHTFYYNQREIIKFLEAYYKHEGYINPKITTLETEDNE